MEPRGLWSHRKKEQLLQARILGLQAKLEEKPSLYLMELEQNLCHDYEDVCFQEELLWHQKSCDDWIQLGDRNTSFFHSKTVAKRRRSILTIQDDTGAWLSDSATLQTMATNFFRNLYTKDDAPLPPFPLSGHFPELTPEKMNQLSSPMTNDELHGTLFDMRPLKEVGPDGLPALFYQSQWSTVAPTIQALKVRMHKRG